MEYSSFYKYLNDELINYNPQKIKKISLPLSIQIELTSMCNMKCKYCYNSSGQKGNNELTIEEWVNVLNGIVDAGGIFQCTFSGGEPLLFNNLNTLMDLLYNDGTSFNLITNGTYLDENKVLLLKKYRWNWIQVSLDSVSPEIHDFVRGYHGGWEKAVNAIKLLKQYKLPVHVACVVTRKNLYDMENFINFCISLDVEKIRFSEVLYSGRACESDLILLNKEKEIFQKSINKFKHNYKNEINIEKATSYKEQLEYCQKFTPLSLIIRPNGDVKLDCVLPFVIGNVAKHSMLDIWENAYMFYESSLKKDYINKCLTGNIEIKNNVDPDIYYSTEGGLKWIDM